MIREKGKKYLYSGHRPDTQHIKLPNGFTKTPY